VSILGRLRHLLGTVTFETPRAEPNLFARLPDEPLADFRIEQKVNRVDEELLAAKRKGDQVVVDALLDQRLALRPPRETAEVTCVPVIPGRSS
jgi:hypothetical protein